MWTVSHQTGWRDSAASHSGDTNSSRVILQHSTLIGYSVRDLWPLGSGWTPAALSGQEGVPSVVRHVEGPPVARGLPPSTELRKTSMFKWDTSVHGSADAETTICWFREVTCVLVEGGRESCSSIRRESHTCKRTQHVSLMSRRPQNNRTRWSPQMQTVTTLCCSYTSVVLSWWHICSQTALKRPTLAE